MTFAWRVARYLAVATVGHGMLAAGMLVLVVLAGAPALGRSDFAAAPWVLAGPALTFGAVLGEGRLRRRGEHRALGQAAAGPRWILPFLLVMALVHLPLLPWSGRPGSPPPAAPPVAADARGDLLMVRESGGVWFGAAGELQVVGEERVAAFRPLPPDPARHRRLLLLAHSPVDPPDDPLDPCWRRWLYLLWACAAPVLPWLLGGRGALPALAPFALLAMIP